MSESNFELIPSGQNRQLDAALQQTGRMLAELDATIEQFDRILPRNVASGKVEAKKLEVISNIMEKAVSLQKEIGYQLESSAETAEGLIDNPSLSEEAQSLTEQKILDLKTRYDALTKKMKLINSRLKVSTN